MTKTKRQFWNHQQRAKRKGIPFELTFDEWYKIWIESGHYENKGTKRGQFVMSRYGDKGGYTIDNVHIQTVGENTKEAFTTNNADFIRPRLEEENYFFGKTHSEESREKIRAVRAKQVFTTESNIKRSEAMKRARAKVKESGKEWKKVSK